MSQVMLDKVEVARIGTPPPKRYKIGELARHTGLTRQTLHNYTRWGLITEIAWTPGGHRLYDSAVFARLALILELKTKHTVKQILAILSENKGVGSRLLPDTHTDTHAAHPQKISDGFYEDINEDENDSRPLYPQEAI